MKLAIKILMFKKGDKEELENWIWRDNLLNISMKLTIKILSVRIKHITLAD